MDTLRRRQEELNVILTQLYEDHALHRLPDDRYVDMSSKYSAEYRDIKTKISQLESSQSEYTEKAKNAADFARLVGQYTDIQILSEKLLHTLIDRIVIHEKEEQDAEIIMKIDIYYRFIGNIGSESGDDIAAIGNSRVKKN